MLDRLGRRDLRRLRLFARAERQQRPAHPDRAAQGALGPAGARDRGQQFRRPCQRLWPVCDICPGRTDRRRTSSAGSAAATPAASRRAVGRNSVSVFRLLSTVQFVPPARRSRRNTRCALLRPTRPCIRGGRSARRASASGGRLRRYCCRSAGALPRAAPPGDRPAASGWRRSPRRWRRTGRPPRARRGAAPGPRRGSAPRSASAPSRSARRRGR